MIVISGEGHKCIAVPDINAGSFHDTQQHVLTELHLGTFSSGLVSLICCFGFRGISSLGLGFCLCRCLFSDSGEIVGFDFITEVDAMEAVQRLSVNFARALDVKGDFEALALLDLGYVPHDVKTAFAVFGGHGDIITLAAGVLQLPILDFKLGWKHVVDVEIAQRGIAVVLKQDQHFVATLSAQRNGLLARTEVAAVVNHLDARRFGWFPGANGAKALCTELNASRSVDTLVAGRGVRGGQRVADLNLLAGLQANGAASTDGQHHGVPLAVRGAVFLLNGDAFRNLGLVLVVVDGLAVDLDGHLLGRGCFEETGDVVGNAHEVDGR